MNDRTKCHCLLSKNSCPIYENVIFLKVVGNSKNGLFFLIREILGVFLSPNPKMNGSSVAVVTNYVIVEFA